MPHQSPHHPNGQNGQASPAQHPSQPMDMGMGGPDFRKTAAVIWKGKWIILACVALFVGAAWIYVNSLPEEFETSSLLLIDSGERHISETLTSDMAGAMGLRNQSVENEIFVLRHSETIANRVAERLINLGQVPDTGERLDIIYNEDGSQRSVNHVAGLANSRMRANSSGREVSALRITAESTVPGEAALISNLFSEEYIDRTRETSRARMQASREFLEDQQQEHDQELQRLEDEIADYMRREGTTSLDADAGRTVAEVAELESRLSQTRIQLDMRRAAMEQLEDELSRIEPRLAESASSSTYRQLRSVQENLARLESRRDAIYQETPELRDNPQQDQSFVEILNRIERLEEREEELAAEYTEETLAMGGVNPLGEGEGLSYVAEQRRQLAQQRIEVSGLEAELEAIQQRLANARQRMNEIPGQSIELAQLQRSRQSAERIAMFLREKLQEVQIAERSEIGYAELIRPANIPGSPVRPNRNRMLIMALLMGLGLGGGIVFLREKFDTRIHGPEDLRAHGHNVTGVIPDIDPLIEDDFDGKKRIEVDGRSVSTSIPMLLSPMSAPSEAYRRLRTNIQFSRPDTVVQTLLITSSEVGEGKSTTAVNLAVAMAQSARKTVIVDADLRRPRQHRVLDLNREPGLSDLLFDRTEFDLSTFSTGIDNLHVIPSGSTVPNPAELLGSKKMRELIRDLRQEFDVIIFDTPPTLAFSDSVLLSTQCDGTLLIASANDTDERAFNHSAEMLQEVGATILGGVLNRFDSSAASYGYGYGYRYGYGYGYGYADQYKRTNRYYEQENRKKNGVDRFKEWFGA